MTENAAQVAAAYFESWRTKDFDRLGSLLADDVTFAGPLGQANGAEECRQGLEGLGRITTDVVVQQTFTDGSDVLTWFELHTTVVPPFSVANWSRVENGRITRVRATFDPRALLAASEPRKDEE
ncbi:nuclear transport factor 2 family protein [Kitasatospora sp. GP82]|uniref:nuclear transport factor 2 family protein n=1 Tax=Kitasatospora sp. GP82 TaxID=3035089 RepID=UPI002474B4A9|nr:nuclear transport factor 2 family protein [Kitasatospora sp. GP82]MDH6124343.1 ketosteroid isomerase-like protein [Kitasatospora sp. GP82]